MAKKSNEEQLAELALKKKALLEKMAQRERLIKARMSKQDRKADTHLKVVYGAAIKAIFEDAEIRTEFKDKLKLEIDKKLTKDRDRELVKNHQLDQSRL
jgi:hypothetical protein